MTEEKTGFDAKGIIGALGKFMRGLKDYNVFELLKILFALFVIALIVSFVRRPETFIEKVSYVFEMRENRLQREHANSSYRRAIADQNIRGYLKELRRLSGADRAWLLEPHNGQENSTTGMPFDFLNLTGDEPDIAAGYGYLNRKEFTDIPTGEYPLAGLIDHKGRWWGPIDSMSKYDMKLYYRMKAQGMGECAVMAAHHMNRPICFVGLTWYEGHHMNPEEVGDLIHKYTMQIALELMKTK